jgi:putative membrane protein
LSCWTGGALALPVVVIATALGMVPPKLGLMRVHLMGVVTLPLALGSGLM